MIEEQTKMLKQMTAEVAAARAQLRDQYTTITVRETVQREADEKIMIYVESVNRLNNYGIPSYS